MVICRYTPILTEVTYSVRDPNDNLCLFQSNFQAVPFHTSIFSHRNVKVDLLD